MRKRINKILSVTLAVSLITGGFLLQNRRAYAETNQPKYIAPYRISEAKLEKYKNMTYEELVNISSTGKEKSRFDFSTIYHRTFDFDNKKCEQFSIFLYAAPEGKDKLHLYKYRWEFRDGVLYSSEIDDVGCTAFTSNFKLVDDTEEIKSNKTSINRKIYNNQLEVVKEVVKDSKLDGIILATSNSFSDSLSGSVLSGKLNAPILFVDRHDDNDTRSFINNNLKDTSTIYVLGGENAISSELIKSMNLNNKYKVHRISGNTKFDTSRLIAENLNVSKGTPIILTNSENYADALSISSIAAIKQYPILLTTKDALPSEIVEELKKINPSKVYVLGGEGTISNSVYEKVKEVAKLSNDNIKRLYGQNRFETSLNIVKEFNINTDTICFASDKNFEDALSGCLLAKNLNAPIILVGEESSKQNDYVESKKYKNQVFFTSFKGLSNSVINKLSAQ